MFTEGIHLIVLSRCVVIPARAQEAERFEAAGTIGRPGDGQRCPKKPATADPNYVMARKTCWTSACGKSRKFRGSCQCVRTEKFRCRS